MKLIVRSEYSSQIKRAFAQVLTIAFLVLLTLSRVGAQTTSATITGTVVDQSGQIVPTAHVTVTNEATGDVRKTDSTASGDFNFPSLLPATYTVVVEKEGFQTFRSPGNILTPNGRLALGELRLSIGATTQTIEVLAQAAQVQTSSAENSGDITREQFSTIPVKGRDLTGLL